MDDRYAIRVAKSKLRDAYNEGDVDGVVAVFGERFVDMSEEQPSFYGGEAALVLRHRLKNLFQRNHVELAVTIVAIRIHGFFAFERGCHQVTLIPKDGGCKTTRRTRYLEIWQKDPKGRWRIVVFLDNLDVAPAMPPMEVLAAMCSGRLLKKRGTIPKGPKKHRSRARSARPSNRV
jgi:ketosteroid isomerase-like protein